MDDSHSFDPRPPFLLQTNNANAVTLQGTNNLPTVAILVVAVEEEDDMVDRMRSSGNNTIVQKNYDLGVFRFADDIASLWMWCTFTSRVQYG